MSANAVIPARPPCATREPAWLDDETLRAVRPQAAAAPGTPAASASPAAPAAPGTTPAPTA